MVFLRSAFVVCLLAATPACGGNGDESTVGNGNGTGAGKGSTAGQPNLGFGGTNGTGSSASGGSSGNDCGPNLTGLVRDFRGANENDGHPDFETFSGRDASLGIVKDTLGPDKKPVYAPAADMPLVDRRHGQQTTNKARFDEWYRNTDGVNSAVEFTVPLTPGQDGIASYDNGAFFPVDGLGFDSEVQGHNFHFTFELHTEFVYRGGEIFTFTGDDDLWVFVNNRLGIDLGGLHPEQSRSIDLDRVADEFELEIGKTYALDLFHAERHTAASHFRVDTSIQFTNCDPIIIPR